MTRNFTFRSVTVTQVKHAVGNSCVGTSKSSCPNATRGRTWNEIHFLTTGSTTTRRTYRPGDDGPVKEIRMRVYVDPDRCRGHARCLSIAPEAFEFVDTEDHAVAVPGAERLVDRAVLEEAVAECPEQAIVIYDETGDNK